MPGRIDAAGKSLVPGFNDMHTHALQSTDPSGELALMLANGITGMRQMAGSPELLAARRAGTLPIGNEAPELLAMPGDILTPANAATPELASATIGKQRDGGERPRADDDRRDPHSEQPGQRVPAPAPFPRVGDLGEELEKVLAAGSRNGPRCHRRAGVPRGRRW